MLAALSKPKLWLVGGWTIIILICSSWVAQAFMYNVNILDAAGIEKLSDEELLNKYIDVMIELEAIETFHQTSGFRDQQEYNKFKGLLRFRTDLLMEMRKREMEIPRITP